MNMPYTYDYSDRNFYNAVFNLLVRECKINDDIYDRANFIDSYCQIEYPCTEFRFIGNLGFGGKFWRNNNRFYINCYQEDENLQRLAIVNIVNTELEKLVIQYEPKTSSECYIRKLKNW